MNKKILGIRIGTFLQIFVCLLIAFAIWFIVKFNNSEEVSKEAAFTLLKSFSLLR